jgi:hypothetical protein
MSTTTHHSSIIAVAELLGRISTDYQFDKAHPNYAGFMNVGVDLFVNDRDRETWWEVVDPENRTWVMPIIEALGMSVEGGKLYHDETIFVKK